MKIFSLAMTIFTVVGTSRAMPQYGPPPAAAGSSPQTSRDPSNAPADPFSQQTLPEGCIIQFQDITTIVEIETEREVCTPYNDRVCDTKYRQACNPYEDTECRTVYKKVCKVKYNEVCNELYRDVPEQYEEDDCKEVPTRVCDSTWVIKGNDKVWEEDPKTCRQIPETQCRLVKKTRTKKVPYTECKNVPYDDCKDAPVEECRKVTKEKCERQEYQDCRDVTKQNCEIIHKKVPQNQTERKAVRVCDGQIQNDVVPFIGGGADDASVFDKSKSGPRDGGEDIESSDDTPFVFSS